MNRIIISLIICLTFTGLGMKKDSWQWLNQQKKMFQMVSADADKILTEIKKKFNDRHDQIKALAILQLDTPYKLFCLGEEKEPDSDPIFRLDCTDCAVLVMTTAALLHSKNLADARTQMIVANYRPIEIVLQPVEGTTSDMIQPTQEMRGTHYNVSYEGRLHYTTNRITTSKFFRDITEEVVGSDKVMTKNVTLNKIKSDGKRNIDIDWEKESVLKYIPNKFVTKELLKKLPRSCGITFYKNSYADSGLDVGHEGLLFDGEILIHASQKIGKVVKLSFWDYYFGKDNPGYDGIILFEIK